MGGNYFVVHVEKEKGQRLLHHWPFLLIHSMPVTLPANVAGNVNSHVHHALP